MGFVFISYSRQDTATVDQIVSRLKSDGFEVWIDRANIKGGDLWTVAIVEAIDTADSFVLMLSPSSTVSDNVRKEVQLAQDAKRKMFPLLIAAVTLPPQFRYQLAGIQFIDYTGNPETKYAELVEVLRTHRSTLLRAEAPATRQVEVVISNANIEKFGAAKKERLLDTVAKIAETARTKLNLANITTGSVHAFINMPTRAAYMLKTAALNGDKRFLKAGIDALRLSGEENYVLISSGEIGPLDLPKRRIPFNKAFLFSIIALGIIGLLLSALFPRARTFIEPALATYTPTAMRTQTLTPTHLFTPISTLTLTPIPTFTPTPTEASTQTSIPNRPPAPPKVYIDSMQANGNVPCSSKSILTWEAYDPDGISNYQVIIDVSNDNGGRWDNVFNSVVPYNSMDISDIASKYCGSFVQVQVSAQDTLGDWGSFSQPLQFYLEPPTPG